VWDFGSAARHHRLYAPQIPERQSLAGMVGMRGAVSPKAGLFRRAAEEIRDILKAEGVAGLPLASISSSRRSCSRSRSSASRCATASR